MFFMPRKPAMCSVDNIKKLCRARGSRSRACMERKKKCK